MSWYDIEKHISSFPAIRKKYFPHLVISSIPKELSPVYKIGFSRIKGGSDDLVKANRMMDGHNFIAIQAVCGTGKTTLLNAFYQENFKDNFDHLLWIDCRGRFKSSF